MAVFALLAMSAACGGTAPKPTPEPMTLVTPAAGTPAPPADQVFAGADSARPATSSPAVTAEASTRPADPPPTPEPAFGLSRRFATLTKGESLALALPEGYEAVWSSTREGVATVDGSGTVTAVGRGQTSILATSPDGTRTDACYIKVSGRGHPAPLAPVAPPRFMLSEDGVYRSVSSDSGKGQATIMLGGDLMCLGSQQTRAVRKDTWDFNASFTYLSPLLAQSDLAIGNLETLLSCSNPYSIEKRNHSENSPNCNAPATFLDGVRHGGFDAVVTANNHMLDGGLEGIYETIERLGAYGLMHTGTWLGADGPRHFLAEVNGIRVAVLAYADFVNRPGSLAAELRAAMTGRYSKETVEQDCLAARAAGAEFIIAYIHWGSENTFAVKPRQKELARVMADAGVDMIAGSHPHCLQAVEVLTASDGRSVLCAYSMGNLLSSMSKSINRETAVLRLQLERDTAGRVGLAAFGFHPCVIESRNGVYATVPIQLEEDSAGYAPRRARIARVLGEKIGEWKIED